MDRAVMNANRDIDRELARNNAMILPTVASVLWHEYGWRRVRIERFFEVVVEVWQECAAAGTKKSMLSMLEEETGIEIQTPGMRSFHEYAYLDADRWDGKPPTKQQLLYIRQQQKKWIPAMLLANVCLALHRREHWGPDRIARMIAEVERIRAERGNDPKKYKDLLEGTEITWEQIKNS